jgi:hypothetical protein
MYICNDNNLIDESKWSNWFDNSIFCHYNIGMIKQVFNMSKCSYCNKRDAEIKIILDTWNGTNRKKITYFVCSDECKTQLELFSGYVNKHVNKFISSILIVILVLIISLCLMVYLNNIRLLILIYSVCIALMGSVFYRYPFATPETCQKYGLRKSIYIIKNIGMGLIITGILGGLTFLLYCFF